MIAITTNSSMSVNAGRRREERAIQSPRSREREKSARRPKPTGWLGEYPDRNRQGTGKLEGIHDFLVRLRYRIRPAPTAGDDQGAIVVRAPPAEELPAIPLEPAPRVLA